MLTTTTPTAVTPPPTGGTHRPRVLLIAYSFPPVGGAGVQRPAKWTKYLPQHGWDVTVLTPSNPSVPVVDESLLREVPDEVAVVRAKTWEPGYRFKKSLAEAPAAVKPTVKARLKARLRRAAAAVLQPDPQVLWLPNAYRAACRLLSRQPHDAILVTAPPYSTFLLGERLKKKFGLPLILDYRDEWDLSTEYLENTGRDGWSRWVQERMQRRVLAAADAVVATTQASIGRLRERLDAQRLAPETLCLYNGFDAEDFAHVPTSGNVPPKQPGQFRLLYTGTLWNLTTIAPLVEGVKTLAATAPDRVARLEVVVVGRKTPEQIGLLKELAESGAAVRNIAYLPHDEVLDWQRSADALLLLLSDVPGAERVVPAKLFEYLAARRDVLTLGPAGETADIIRRFFPDSDCPPADAGCIAGWLRTRLASPPAESAVAHAESELHVFERKHQAGQLAALLERVATRVPAAGTKRP